MITIVYTLNTRNQFTDTLLHIDDPAIATVDELHAFVSGVWWAFTNTRDGARCKSLDVIGTFTDGARFAVNVCRGTSGWPDITYV